MVRLFRLCEEIEDRHDYNYDLQIMKPKFKSCCNSFIEKKDKVSFHFVQDDNSYNKMFLSFWYEKKNPMIYVFLYENFEFRLG